MTLFHRIDQPSPWRFILAVTFWFALGSALISVWAIIYTRGNIAEISRAFHELKEYPGFICSVLALLASVLGAGHYMLLRLLGRRRGKPFRFREAGAVVLAVVAISAVPGIVVKRAFERGSHERGQS